MSRILGEDGKPMEPEPTALAFGMFHAELAKIIQNTSKIDELVRINLLRESCGVKSETLSTVNVRKPPRYTLATPSE